MQPFYLPFGRAEDIPPRRDFASSTCISYACPALAGLSKIRGRVLQLHPRRLGSAASSTLATLGSLLQPLLNTPIDQRTLSPDYFFSRIEEPCTPARAAGNALAEHFQAQLSSFPLPSSLPREKPFSFLFHRGVLRPSNTSFNFSANVEIENGFWIKA